MYFDFLLNRQLVAVLYKARLVLIYTCPLGCSIVHVATTTPETALTVPFPIVTDSFILPTFACTSWTNRNQFGAIERWMCEFTFVSEFTRSLFPKMTSPLRHSSTKMIFHCVVYRPNMDGMYSINVSESCDSYMQEFGVIMAHLFHTIHSLLDMPLMRWSAFVQYQVIPNSINIMIRTGEHE